MKYLCRRLLRTGAEERHMGSMAQLWLGVMVLLAGAPVPGVQGMAATVTNAGELWEALAKQAVSTVTIQGARPAHSCPGAPWNVGGAYQMHVADSNIRVHPTGRVRLMRESWPGTAIIGPGRHVTLQSGALHATAAVRHMHEVAAVMAVSALAACP